MALSKFPNEQELILYEQEIKRICDNYNAALYLIEKAQREGMEKEKLAIVKRIMVLEIDPEIIAKAVGLSLEEIKEITKSINT